MRTDLPKRSPGRPLSFESDKILEEVVNLFWCNGFRSTSTRDLESKLGLKQSSIYNHFGSKQNLLYLALDRYEREVAENLLGILDDPGDGISELQLFFDKLVRWVTRDGHRGCLLINTMAEDAGETADITKRSRQYRSKLRQKLKRCLAQAQRDGDESMVESQAELLVGFALGICIAVRGGASRTELGKLNKAASTYLESIPQ